MSGTLNVLLGSWGRKTIGLSTTMTTGTSSPAGPYPDGVGYSASAGNSYGTVGSAVLGYNVTLTNIFTSASGGALSPCVILEVQAAYDPGEDYITSVTVGAFGTLTVGSGTYSSSSYDSGYRTWVWAEDQGWATSTAYALVIN